MGLDTESVHILLWWTLTSQHVSTQLTGELKYKRNQGLGLSKREALATQRIATVNIKAVSTLQSSQEY